MASATLFLCASFASHCSLTHRQSPSFPTTSTSSLCFSSRRLPSQNLSLYSISPSRLPFSSIPKSSESEAAVVAEAEPQSSELQAAEIVKASPEEQAPKREEVFAVVMVSRNDQIGKFMQCGLYISLNDCEFYGIC